MITEPEKDEFCEKLHKENNIQQNNDARIQSLLSNLNDPILLRSAERLLQDCSCDNESIRSVLYDRE